MSQVGTKQSLATQISGFLKTEGHTLVDRPNPPWHVGVKLRGSAAIAKMQFADSDVTLVLKAIEPNCHALHAQELCSVQNILRSSDDVLASVLPHLAITGPKKQWVAMKFINGRTLEELLRRKHRRGSQGGDWVATQALRELGTITARIHRINAASLNYHIKARPNETFWDHLAKHWNTAIVPRLLPAGCRKPDELRQLLPAEFGLRQVSNLLLVDLQPKNVIVDNQAKLHLIDPGYIFGNPAMAVGFFLNCINQLALDYEIRVSPKTIRKYQRTFLEEYLGQVGQDVAQDLIFFYPWTLIETARLHIQRRSMLRFGLKTAYSFYMRRYLRYLKTASVETRQRPHADLFTGGDL